jgi:hypothetical protein
MNRRFRPRDLFLLTAWLALLVLAMARGTLALPYLSDDFEHVLLVAQIRAGLEPARDLLMVPFHGQTLVLLRLLFWFGTLAGGTNPTWVRLGICAVHVAGAAGCAILCTRWTGSRFAGFMAGTLYAGAFGFINEQIYWPASAIFCLGVTFLVLAMVALNSDSNHPTRALAVSVLMLVLAALGLNGILAAALGLPIYCWLLMPPTVFWRKRAPLVFLAAIALLLALSFWQQMRQHDQQQMKFSVHALEFGAWLIFTAPFRFFSGFTTFSLPLFQTIRAWSPLAWLPLLASVWFMNAHYRRVLLAVWTPAILLAMLVGISRADNSFGLGPGSIYIADRYYYVFLLPLVVHCVLFVNSFHLSRFGILAVFAVLAAALFGSRAHYVANLPLNNFEPADHALQQGRLLAQTIRSAASGSSFPASPLILTDGAIPIDGALKNSLSLAFLVYSEYPQGIPGVRIVRGPINAQQAAFENASLNRWATAASLPASPACVQNGLLLPVRATSRIDFKNASYEENLGAGFSWWERPFRWMAGHASVHLLSAPGDFVVSAYAPAAQLHRPIHVSVAINDRPAGGFTIGDESVHDYHLQPPTLPPGTAVDIALTNDFIWHARDIQPQSLDDRILSIAIFAIGFGDPHQPYQLSPCRETLR